MRYATMKAGVLAIVAMCVSASPVIGADRFWNNSQGGAFNTPLNWSPNPAAVPGPNDNAIFSVNSL